MLHEWCRLKEWRSVEPPRQKQALLAHLTQCEIFHFAGHSATIQADPLGSHLLLEDWRQDLLSVISLFETNIRKRGWFLAYLSACGSCQNESATSLDESLHIASAFQLAGFRHVIGTLWDVNDEICVDMARTTYKVMGNAGMTDESVSLGLHHAMREARERNLYALARGRLPLNKDETATRRGDRSLRNADISDDDDNDEDLRRKSLLWVPYVHYGM